MSCRISQHSFGVKLQRQDAELSPLYSPFILCCSLQSGKAFQHSSSLTSHRTAVTQPSDHSSSSQGIQKLSGLQAGHFAWAPSHSDVQHIPNACDPALLPSSQQQLPVAEAQDSAQLSHQIEGSTLLPARLTALKLHKELQCLW